MMKFVRFWLSVGADGRNQFITSKTPELIPSNDNFIVNHS